MQKLILHENEIILINNELYVSSLSFTNEIQITRIGNIINTETFKEIIKNESNNKAMLITELNLKYGSIIK